MKPSFSGKGKAWEWKHSFWMLWSLTIFGWTTFISFLYIGRKTKTKKWTIAGIIYLVWTIFMLSGLGYLLIPTIVGSIGVIIWIWSIIHVFLVRKEYLVRLSYIINHPEIQEKSRKEYYNSVTEDYTNNVENTAVRVITMPAKKQDDQNFQTNNNIEINNNSANSAKNLPNNLIDINKCNTEDLLLLPGFSLPLAKKVMDRRNNEGYFSSIDEFLDYIMVKPHFSVQIKEMITVSEYENSQRKRSSQRNVDF